jgi:hypothetical protein
MTNVIVATFEKETKAIAAMHRLPKWIIMETFLFMENNVRTKTM